MSEPQPPVQAESARIPYDRLAGFSRLFRGYTAADPDVLSFYARDWRRDVAEAAGEAAARPRDRETLVRVLRSQQARWGPDARADAQIERLLDPDSAVIVTGQQVGLYTGPLYTILKALTTLALAEHIERETGRPMVPVFWLGAEDHDLEEMAGAGLPSRDGLVDCRYAGHSLPDGGNLGPVGALAFSEDIERVHDTVQSLLQPTDFRDPVMDLVRRAYPVGGTFTDGFGTLLRALLPDQGLVLLSADAPELKRLAAPLWRREITDWKSSTSALKTVSERLDRDFHAQVHVRPTNLFLLHEGQRLPIDADDEGFEIRGADLRFSESDLLEHLETHPEQFSANVVMRPLTQDWLLPTAAYVAGPGETAYFAQYAPVYDWAGLPMPAIYPRVSVTLVERHIRKALNKLDREVDALSGDVERLFSELVKEQLDFDLDARFGSAAGELHRTLGQLKSMIVDIDASLGKTVEAARASISSELDRLKGRVVRSERRRHEELRAKLDKALLALFPDGKPQERAVSPLYFVNKYGLDFFVRLRERLPLDTSVHYTLDL